MSSESKYNTSRYVFVYNSSYMSNNSLTLILSILLPNFFSNDYPKSIYTFQTLYLFILLTCTLF